MLRFLSLILFLTLLNAPSFAQQNQVVIQIVQPAPMSGFEGTLNSLANMGDRFVAIVILPGWAPGVVRAVNLVAALRSIDGLVTIRTRTSTPFLLNQPQTLVRGNTLPRFFDSSTIETIGLDEGNFFNGGDVPQGTYALCVGVFDATVGDGFTSQISEINCVQVVAQSPEPPRLVTVAGQPFTANTVVSKSISLLPITWIPTVVAPGVPTYTVRIVDMGDVTVNPEVAGMDPNVAIQQNRQPNYTSEPSPLPGIVVGADAGMQFQFESNHRYAVVVQAAVPGVYIKNDGKSEVKSFWYDKTESAPVPSEPKEPKKPASSPEPTPKPSALPTIALRAYPQDGSFMPFRGMPVIVKYDPYSDAYKRFDSEFTIGGLPVFKRTLGWASGPLASQNNNTGSIPLTEEDAQYIAISQNKKHSDYNSFYVNGLVRGQTYSWNSSVWISGQAKERDNARRQELTGSFKAGMGAPVLQLPANKDTLEGGDISFEFRTAETPAATGGFNFNKCFDIVQASRGQVEGFAISIHEKGVLEVSDSESFENVMFRDSVALKKAFDQGENGNAVLEYVYSDKTNLFKITEEGTYYWRVRWLTNPDGASTGPSYSDSETREFTIGKPSDKTDKADGETPPQVAKDCKADCDIPLPAGPVAVGIAENVQVKVGHFTLLVTKATVKAGNVYDGEGHITNFSLWGYEPELKVTFKNLKVTKAGTYLQAFAGEVDTETGGHELLNLTEMVLGQPLTLPLGADFMLGGNRFILQLTALKFLPTKAEASIRIAGHIPGGEGDERRYDLVANPVCIVPGGFGKPARFFLNANIYGSAETDSYQFYVKGKEEGAVERSSFVEFKCDTISLQLAGGLRFPRTKLLPEDDLGNIIAGNVDAEFLWRIDQRVSREDSPAGVTTTGMMAGLTFNHPFQVVGLEGWGFKIQDAFIDMSDMSNPPEMQFPAAYSFESWLPAGQYVNEQLRKTWKGVYGKTFALRLPKELAENRKSFAVNDLIIDKTGLTVSAEAQNILSADEAGWGFTISKLTLSVIQTSTLEGNMKGKIQLPVFDADDRLNYNMVLSSQPAGGPEGPNYICTVSVPGSEALDMNLWLAKVQLDPSSQVEFSVGRESKARLKGHLNGSFGIFPGERDDLMGLKLTDVRFENFSFDTDVPGFFTFDDVSYSRASGQPVVSFASPQHSAAKFPLTINEIDFVSSGSGGYTNPGLHLDADLALSDEITAGLALTIYGKIKLDGVKPVDVGYDHTDLEAIRLDVETKGFTLKGEVQFYKNHTDYGNGFYGNVAVTMPMKIGGRLMVRFGTMGEAGQPDYYSYWFVDGMIHLASGIAVGPMSLNAFGGGAYHHMRLANPGAMTAEAASQLAREALKEPDVTPANIPESGLKFVPDKNVYLGIRAGVVASITGAKDVFNMDVGLTAEVSAAGGLNSVSLNGNGYLLQELDKREDPPMKASVLLTYDRTGESSRLDGTFTVMVDFYDILVGNQIPAQKIAGQAQLHIDDEMWYFYLGNPARRAGLKASIKAAGTEVMSADMNAYFMVGHGIPTELPPLPDFIRNLLNRSTGNKVENQATSDNRTPRSPALYETGKGIAFGATFDKRIYPSFLVFYADLRMVVGADINITKNAGAVCEGSDEPRGVNGWYGQGQAYAGIDGRLGIHVDLVFAEGKYEIAQLAAAISLTAKLPNPNYFAGRAALYYSILDGWVDGYCNFNIELGENCIVAGNNPLGEFTFISDMQPDGSEQVSPGTEVTTSFYFPMNKAFELEEILPDNSVRIRKFKPFIKRYELYEVKPSGSQALVANLSQRLERNNVVAVLSHRDYLKGNTPYQAVIEVQVYETTSGSDVLVKKPNSNDPFSEPKTVTFRTGPLPQVLENVTDSWPIRNQRFFLQNQGLEAAVAKITPGDEFPCTYSSRGKKGYVKVGGQAYLFTNSTEHNTQNAANDRPTAGRSVTYKAVFTAKDGGSEPVEANMKYFADAGAIEFDIPQLANSTTYQLDIIRRVNPGVNATPATSVAIAEEREVTTLDTRNRKGQNVVLEGGNSTVARRQVGIRGVSDMIAEPPVFTVFSYTFRTSQYNTHRDKLAALSLTPGQTTFLGVRTWTAETDEAFETADLPASILIANRGTSSVSGSCGRSQTPLMQLYLPDMDDTYLSSAHQKFGAVNTLYTGYRSFNFPGIRHEKNTPNATESQIRSAIRLGGNGNTNQAGFVLNAGTSPKKIISNAYAPTLTVLPNLLGSDAGVPMPFRMPYYVSSGLSAPLEPAAPNRPGPNVAVSAVAVNIGSASASTASGPSPGGAPQASPGGPSPGSGKPKLSIMDMTDLVLTSQNYQIISNLLDFKQIVPQVLTTPLGDLTLYNAAEKSRVDNLIRQEQMLQKVIHLSGKQRIQFIYWVPTMYGPYPTAPITFEGTVK